MIAKNEKDSADKVLVWFRKDLRLRDNPTLEHALASSKQIVPVFIWDEEEGGNWSPGAASRWWLHQSLKSLAASIERLGGSLLFEKGKPADVLPLLAKENGADDVFYSRVYDPGGMDAQEAVGQHATLEIGADLALDEAGDGCPGGP